MSCIPCFSSHGKRAKRLRSQKGPPPFTPPSAPSIQSQIVAENQNLGSITEATSGKDSKEDGTNNIAAQTFTFRELANATKNFRPGCLLGEGGFGRVYKGKLSNGQTVAVKQLDRNGLQGNKEFLVEVLMLSLLHHPNLVNLIGYCADGDQRLLVYEYMPLGSLENHLLDVRSDQKPLDWYSRMKTALGAAMGIEYLHDKANPPVIYRDLKSSNILLDEDFHAKLSDFGLAKLGPTGGKTHVSTRVMGTYGYCAPEYQRTGRLTAKSDIYSFGVVLLELITGRRAIDTSKPNHEQHLVAWAQPMFREQSRYHELADPLLGGDFPVKGLNQAVAVAAMCLQEEETARPLMSDVVTALSFLTMIPKDGDTSPLLSEPSRESDFTAASSRHEEESVDQERQRAVAEAMEWGSNHPARSEAQSQPSGGI